MVAATIDPSTGLAKRSATCKEQGKES